MSPLDVQQDTLYPRIAAGKPNLTKIKANATMSNQIAAHTILKQDGNNYNPQKSE